jgi:hypothetical protein
MLALLFAMTVVWASVEVSGLAVCGMWWVRMVLSVAL